MKQPDKQNLIEYRIRKSKETAVDAKIALENNRLTNALNRIYYAVFYMVSALSLKHDFSTSKHKQLMGWFNVNFVHSELISVDLWKIYKNAFDKRQESDYDDYFELDESEIKHEYDEMLIFISEIEKIIKE